MSLQKGIIAWIVFFLFTIGFGLIRTQRLELTHVAISAAAASILVLLSSLLPAEYTLTPGRLVRKWVVTFAAFSTIVRIIANSTWSHSLGTGFYSATCLILLDLFA